MTTDTEVVKKGIFGMKKKSAGESSDVAKSPGMFGTKKNHKNVDTPSTVIYDDDDNNSTGSSVSGSGRKKKPRAEYKKQIATLTEEKKTLVAENKKLMEDFDVIEKWAMSPPLPDSASKVLVFDGAEHETTYHEEPEMPSAPKSVTRIFGKKPRAEYQAEIDALCNR
jgi:hypothetical protein